jgi:ribosomal protein S18 acetylase RimI-like enzyme
MRCQVVAADSAAVSRIVQATGFFRSDEVDVAVELVEERLAKGVASGYHFVFAEMEGSVAGYACYGPIACTIGSYDLYWIAVDPKWQGRGMGRLLLCEVEQQIRQCAGRHIYIETSGRPQYQPTRAFYERSGYEVVAVLQEFYDHDDDKVVWRKICRDESAASGSEIKSAAKLSTAESLAAESSPAELSGE